MINGKIENLNSIDHLLLKVTSSEKDLIVKASSMALMLDSMIMVKLQQYIGDKAKHFTVKTETSGVSFHISIITNSQVGNFIYTGTGAHNITSSSEAMPMPDGGFTRSVSHPGTPSMKKEIDSAVKDALSEIRRMF